MTSDPTFNELNTLDGELLPERTVLSVSTVGGDLLTFFLNDPVGTTKSLLAHAITFIPGFGAGCGQEATPC